MSQPPLPDQPDRPDQPDGPPSTGTGRRRPAWKRPGPVAWVATAVGVAVIVLLVVLASGEPRSSVLIGSSAVGLPVPELSGVTIDGTHFDVDDHRGRWVVVNFFASWCVGCIIEHPELVEFSARHRSGDAIVVSVAFDDPPDAVADFFARNGGDWPVIADVQPSVPVDFGVTAVPETYLVSPAGYVVDKLVGSRGVTADGLDARITALSALADDT